MRIFRVLLPVSRTLEGKMQFSMEHAVCRCMEETAMDKDVTYTHPMACPAAQRPLKCIGMPQPGPTANMMGLTCCSVCSHMKMWGVEVLLSVENESTCTLAVARRNDMLGPLKCRKRHGPLKRFVKSQGLFKSIFPPACWGSGLICTQCA